MENLYNIPTSEKYFRENFLEIFRSNNKIEFLNECLKNPKMVPIIFENIVNIFKYFSSTSLIFTLDAFEDHNLLDEFNSSLNDHFEEILNNTSFLNVYTILLLDRVKITKENKEIFNEYLLLNKDQLIQIIMEYSIDGLYYEELYFVVEKLLDEICENEGLRYADIKRVDSFSCYSKVYIIGTKVFKIGTREVYKIPDDPRLLKPLIRVDLKKYSNRKLDKVIEVQEFVDTNLKLTVEEKYAIYKEMRERGVIFADLKTANFGRLLKDNNTYWNKELADIRTAKGFRNISSTVLKKGEIVILDTDYLYFEKDKNIDLLEAEDYEDFYIKEKELIKKN